MTILFRGTGIFEEPGIWDDKSELSLVQNDTGFTDEGVHPDLDDMTVAGSDDSHDEKDNGGDNVAGSAQDFNWELCHLPMVESAKKSISRFLHGF